MSQERVEVDSPVVYTPGVFVQYRLGPVTSGRLRYGRVMLAPVSGSVHLQRFLTSGETVLEGCGCPQELYSTTVCKEIRCDLIQRIVQVRGPYDIGKQDHAGQFTYRFRYNAKDGSFVEEGTLYGVADVDFCVICRSAQSLHEGKTLYLTWMLLRRPLKHTVTLGMTDVLEPGVFVATTRDVAQFSWRRKVGRHQVAQPVCLSDDVYPEAWRLPRIASCPYTMNTRSVCRIKSIEINTNVKRHSRRQVLDPDDLVVVVDVFVRPEDIGLKLKCPYELLKSSEVLRLTGRDIHSVVEVHHASAHIDLLGWIRRGVYVGRPRFHYTYEVDPVSRAMNPSPPEAPRNRVTTPPLPQPKLTSLELYSGCGGLTHGLDASGLTNCKWAVEIDPQAAKVFAANFSDCKVYVEDVEIWLENLKKNKLDNTLPQPGTVDLIAGGPPCQGYSRLNRHKSSEDAAKKRAHSLVFVAACCYIKPKFIVFENVADFARCEKGANLQAVIAELIKNGYQVRFTVLRAAAHGVPQTRQRTIIMAALLGEKLPKFPTENYYLPGKLADLKFGSHKVCFRNQGPVLYGEVGVSHAIEDLQNTKCVVGSKRTAQYQECNSVLQKKLREGCGKVTWHTEIHPLSELDALRMKHIPQGGDWRHIPNQVMRSSDGRVLSEMLTYKGYGASRTMCKCTPGKKCTRNRHVVTTIPWCLAHSATNNGNWKGAFGRLEYGGFFPTLITNPGPAKSNGRIIHPTKDRYISIREAARAQTFPDSFKLLGNSASAMKQLGNAVPPLLAEAIGLSFLNRCDD